MPVITSTPSTTATASLTVASWWLKDPTTPSRNMNVFPDMPVKTAKDETQTVLRPLGRTREVVVADTITGEHLTLDLWFTSAVDATKFETLRNSQRVLLLQSSGTEQWYGRIGARRSRTILATPDLSWRQISVEFIETDAV